MRKISALVGLAAAAAAILSACSPAPATGSDEKRLRTEPVAAAVAAPREETLPPVTDAQGNEVDPVLADAFRAKVEEDKMAAEEAAQAAAEKGEADTAQNGASDTNDKT